MTLTEATEGKEYKIKSIASDDDELRAFLFSLGCYEGELITVVAGNSGGYVVSVKDSRYNIDRQLADAICV